MCSWLQWAAIKIAHTTRGSAWKWLTFVHANMTAVSDKGTDRDREWVGEREREKERERVKAMWDTIVAAALSAI